MEAKYIKPDLINPVIRQRIIKTIQPPGETQWKPVKKFFSSFSLKMGSVRASTNNQLKSQDADLEKLYG